MTDDELLAKADEAEGEWARRRRSIEDFRYDEVQEKYWDTTTGNLLGARSVDGAVHRAEWPVDGKERPVQPSLAINNIDTGLTVEGSTWWPGEPRFIIDRVVTERGAMRIRGAVCYNSYIAPGPPPDTRHSAQRWVKHVRRLYSDPVESEHFFDYCAHAIQRPDEKVNHGIVMSGTQGIGKDTALAPVRAAVGEWNAAEVGPDAIHSAYNGYIKAVLLVINEVRPHDEEYRASNFYNMLKPLLAAPPEMLPMTLKYANTIYVRNLVHVVLTTNDPLTMFIPPEDRRLFVMSSEVKKGELSPKYFSGIYRWFSSGGYGAVNRWLRSRDLSSFAVATPPPITAGKTAIINSSSQVRRTRVDDVIEEYVEASASTQVIFHRDLTDYVRMNGFDDAEATIRALNSKSFHFKMSEHGYEMVRCPTAGEWRRGKFRSRMAFVSHEVPRPERAEAAREALEGKG